MTQTRTDRRPTRRMGAQARAAQRAARTAQDQLTLVHTRPGDSVREVARLESQLPPVRAVPRARTKGSKKSA